MRTIHTISQHGRVFVVLVVLQVGACGLAWAQVGKPAAKPTAASAGPESTAKGAQIPLSTKTTVTECVAVEAALLPKEPAQQLFGGWVASNYAVVRVNISNHCKDQQMILHDVFFDYSQWALSGLLPSQTPPKTEEKDGYTKKTTPGEVASMGAKEVSNELTEASVFSRRNLVVNGLVLAGTVAGGYSFLASTDYSKGVAAYSSEFIPGLQKFWPDRRPEQESQLLLYGFQVNKVISKQTADFVYAFFPLDRFLTPGLKKLFLKTPAVFFNPSLIFMDHTVREFDPLRKTIEDVTQVTDESEILRELNDPCSLGKKDDKNNPNGEVGCDIPKGDSRLVPIQMVKGTLASVSLNSVHIVVSGIMTVDVDSIPAGIDAVAFDGDKPLSKPGTVTGAITGRFLTNGVPEITGITVPGVSKPKVIDYIDEKSIAAVADGASDTKLPFTFKLTTAIPSGSKLTFQVKKVAKSGDNAETTQTESMKFEYALGEAGATTDAPEITKKPAIDNDTTKAVWESTTGALTCTITGKNLKGGVPTIPDVKLGATDETAFVDAKSIAVDAAKSTDTSLSFSFKLLKPVAVGSKVSFVVTTKDADGKPLKSSANDDYTVPKSSAAEAPAAKPVVKKKAPAAGVKPGPTAK